MWRMLLLTPVVAIVGVLGTIFLTLVLAATFFAPLLAIVLISIAEYWWALITIVAWLLCLKYGGPLRRWAFEGFEHGGL